MVSHPKVIPTGQMVDIGGFRLHALVCGQGAPVVLLEPALGGFALQYSHIQSAVSAFTRVLAYDRAGQGWSDFSPNPRKPINLAAELKALLGSLDLQPPYVLVGHSFGGLLTRIYAGFYPEEVAGVVLVDANHVDEWDSYPDIDKMVSRAAMGVRLLKFVSRLGLGKQLTKISLGSAAKSLSKEDLNVFLAVASQPKHHETMLAEVTQHRFYLGPQSEVPRTLGDTPLIVVTAGNSVSGSGKIGSMTGEQVNALHQRLQRDLVQLSSQSEQLIVPGATHLSILTQAEYAAQVVDAIRRLVEKVRKIPGVLA
ncbi:MAG: alpha/beta hydrolase [Anaerolineaceae bacterium]|nr:alpha/beta hydrolase [Anaerolineaceae bacterium]